MFGVLPLEIRQRVATGPAPAANVLLIVANVLMYLFGWLTGWCWPVGPGSGPFSVLSYGFCHAGFWHLLFNMWSLWVFGNPVNRRLGNEFYLLAYLGTVLFLGVFARLFYHGLVIGASGGVFAVIAISLLLMPAARLVVAYWAIFPFSLIPALIRRPRYGIFWFIDGGSCEVKMLWCLALIVFLELYSLVCSFFTPYASVWNVGHLLGFLCGAAIVLMLPTRITMKRTVADSSY